MQQGGVDHELLWHSQTCRVTRKIEAGSLEESPILGDDQVTSQSSHAQGQDLKLLA